ncbi:uncharacterized protein LOC125280001 isoform X2 [Megalobrama amblycephala]|uniref:uncharacterized protein LOC125280001 isoform X2 n=1 Tax=Megalobrama amblycephala TaxID=75352 RepID=UPI0020146428|nr:uncharacterized protein LOC125280001 isoform X2 [Megalobrama amblycephala]
MKNKIRVSFSQIIWRVCNLFMSVFFSLATYAQINDPDAALWMVGYAVPAGLCFLICCEQQITGGNYRYFPARGRKGVLWTPADGFLAAALQTFRKESCRLREDLHCCGNHCVSLHHMDLLLHEHRAEETLA